MSHLCSGCFTEIEPWATLCRSCQVEPEGAAPLPDDLLALAVDDVSAVTGVAPDALLGRGRSLSVTRARKALYVRLYERGLSYPEIGQLVGRDHSTIHYGVNGKAARSAP